MELRTNSKRKHCLNKAEGAVTGRVLGYPLGNDTLPVLDYGDGTMLKSLTRYPLDLGITHAHRCMDEGRL
jgi:hypothetical protein